MNYILIDVKKDKNSIAIVEEDRLVEFYIEKHNEKILGNIYRGKVVNVLPGMEAAFVDIGEKKNAYLYIKDVLPRERYHEDKPSIEDLVKVGDDIIVQVIKEAIGTKGPKVTAHITIPSNYMVLTPYSSKVSISRKIADKDEVKRLLKVGENIKREEIGMIFRTASENIEEAKLEEELNFLIDLYRKIERERNFSPSPKLIYKEMDSISKIVRDIFINFQGKLIINNIDKYRDILDLIEGIDPNAIENIELRDGEDIFKTYNITDEIKKALGRKVFLRSGGYLVIDETEALTSIDVNTGKYIGKIDLESTVLKTNLEAVEELARQLRLRNIGGIVIIDFIAMKNKEDEELLLDSLEEELKKDRTKTSVMGITKLGLVEMTRKKVRNRLSWNYFKVCPHCDGKGKILID